MSRAWIREFAGDDVRVWLSAATVQLHKGETQHWRVNDEGDLEVQVAAHQHQVEMVAVMGGLGAQGVGFWRIPDIGDEVIVATPDDFEGDATIIALMSTGSVPGDLSPTVLLVRAPAGGKVHIHDGGGQGPLATLADLQDLRDYVATQFLIAGHSHTVSGSTTTAVTAIAPGPAVPEGPTAPANPSGTEVLEAR